MTEGLPKSQRLYRKKAVQALFNKGRGFTCYPFRVIVYLHDCDNPEEAIARIVVSVSKKRFHHAVNRNRVKRLIREAWRKNKSDLMELCKLQNKTLDLAFVYTATIILSYSEIEKKIKQMIVRLRDDYFNDEKAQTTAG